MKKLILLFFLIVLITFPCLGEENVSESEKLTTTSSISGKDKSAENKNEQSIKVDRDMKLAMMYLDEENYVYAKIYFEEIKELMPQSSKGYIGLGDVDCHLGKFDIALSNLEQAAKLDPDNELIYEYMTIVYKGMGKIAEEKQMLHKFIELRKKKAIGYREKERIWFLEKITE